MSELRKAGATPDLRCDQVEVSRLTDRQSDRQTDRVTDRLKHTNTVSGEQTAAQYGRVAAK